MSKFTTLDQRLYDYLLAHRTPDDALVEALIEETRRLLPAQAQMQIAPEQGRLLTLLTRLRGVREAVEVGTFTGLSSLAIARGLAPGGSLLALDLSAEYTAIARRYWERAGVSASVELRLGPALESLRALPRKPRFELAFIDADKGGYLDYYEELVPRLHPNGLILADNVLWSGRIADPLDQQPDTLALRRFNDRVSADERVEVVTLAIADGLLLARVL